MWAILLTAWIATEAAVVVVVGGVAATIPPLRVAVNDSNVVSLCAAINAGPYECTIFLNVANLVKST